MKSFFNRQMSSPEAQRVFFDYVVAHRGEDLEGVNHYEYDKDKNESQPVAKDLLYNAEDLEDGYIWYKPSSVYVEGTKRGFIEPDESIYVGYGVDDKNIITTYCHFKQAWNVEAQELAAISDKYFLSFRLFAVEHGMGFTQTIHIESPGRIVEDSAKNYGGYEDFVWNCPCPDLGG